MSKKRVVQTSSTALLTFDAFFNQFTHKVYKKRTAILNAGIAPKEIYYLKRGYARAYAVSNEGKDLTMVIFQPGDFFPLISTIIPKKIDYYLESLTEVEIIPVPRAQFIEFLKSDQELLIDFALRLTARFEGVLTRMEYLVFGNASQKLASILLILGERFGEKRDSTIFIKAPLTHRDLASLVGITRETTTLILRDFTKKKLISFRSKHLIISNSRGLQHHSLTPT